MKDSILMYYLDSLASTNKKREQHEVADNNKVNEHFFVIDQLDNDTLETLLRKKIEIIRKIQQKRNGDPKEAAIFFAPFADKCWSLQRAYVVTLQSYKHNIAKGEQEPDRKVLLEIADKMILAALLEAAVYRDSYSNREALRSLEQLLYDLSCEWSTYEKPIIGLFDSGLNLYENNPVAPNPIIAQYSEYHNSFNIWRFLLFRFWRWLTQHVTKAFVYCKSLISSIQDMKNNGVGDAFSYVSWLFFIPRIIINLCTTIYSIIGTLPIFGRYKLPEMEKEYGWYLRLKIRLNAIFFEMANDWMWFWSGLINCFALAGNLPVIGLYIMVAAQTYDFSVIMLRNFVDSWRLNKLQADMEKIKRDNSLDDPNWFLNNLRNRIELDKKALLYAIFNFAILLMCISLMTPAFGHISPFIPLIASLITIIVAPLRGFTILHFKKEAMKLNPPLISKNACGFIVLEEGKDVSAAHLLGRYKQGLVGVKNSSGELSELFYYKKGNESIKINDWDKNDFDNKKLYLYSRVRTVSAEFVTKQIQSLDGVAIDGSKSYKMAYSMVTSGG